MDDWLSLAKQLPLGQSVRVQCCNKNTTCILSSDIQGYRKHCFRCNDTQFKPRGQLSAKEALQRKRDLMCRIRADGCLSLPEDYTVDIPEHAASWFLKYGISSTSAVYHDIGYSPKLDRIVLPVYEGADLVAMQMRAVSSGQQPKYLNPNGPKTSEALFYTGKRLDDGIKPIVVTEDILSAIKISLAGTPAASIMGTTCTDGKAFKIAQKAEQVIVWLDGDQAGRSGARKAVRKLSLYTDDIRVIHTEKDPKEYNRDEIREILKDHE